MTKNKKIIIAGVALLMALRLHSQVGGGGVSPVTGVNPYSYLNTIGLTLTPVVSPTTSLTATLAGSGSSNTNGAHNFIFSWSEGPCVNLVSPQTYTNLNDGGSAATVTVTSNHDVTLSAIPVPTDPRVTNTCIWETLAGTTTGYFYVDPVGMTGGVPAGTTTATIAQADSGLTSALQQFWNGAFGNSTDSGINTTACVIVNPIPASGIIPPMECYDEGGDTLYVGGVNVYSGLNYNESNVLFITEGAAEGLGRSIRVDNSSNSGNFTLLDTNSTTSGFPAPGTSVVKFPAAGGNLYAELAGTTGSIGGGVLTSSCTTGTATVTGAVVGQDATAVRSDGSLLGNFNEHVNVSSSNTVTVQICGTGTPAAVTYNVFVRQP